LSNAAAWARTSMCRSYCLTNPVSLVVSAADGNHESLLKATAFLENSLTAGTTADYKKGWI
jgi:hypothetical protein